MRQKLPKSPRLKIEVTREIMDQAKQRESSHCMVAEAVKVAFPDAKAVSVDVGSIRFTDPRKGLRYIYLTPRVAQVEIVKFDQGIESEPFSLLLRGGQVTRAGATGMKKPLTEEQKQQREELKKKRLVPHRPNDPMRSTVVPDIIGGQPPPRVGIGERREFGLRAMAR